MTNKKDSKIIPDSKALLRKEVFIPTDICRSMIQKATNIYGDC